MNPLRQATIALANAVTLAGMRPPLSLPSRTNIDLRDKRVLLTGASSGIGAAAALKFGALGATVFAVARRAELLDEVVGHIAEAGGTAHAFPCDLSDLDAIDALVNQVGPVDILINNAGRSIRRPLEESLDRWHDVERTMTLNYYSPLRLIRGVAPGMLKRGEGHIINVSTWGVMNESVPLFAAYNASKAALSTVSRAIETEWAPKGIKSTTLYYPLVATPMIAPTKAYDGLPALSAEEAAGWMIDAARTRPVRIAPRIAVTSRAVDALAPGVVTALMRRQGFQPG